MQAKAVACNPAFVGALASAKRPLFVSSNLVRAVKTMALAAPGHRVVVQPHARELIKGSHDFPSSLEALERWAQDSDVKLDLGPYRCALHENERPNFTDYVRSLCEVDCTIISTTLCDNIEAWDHIVATFGEEFHMGLTTLPTRVNRLMWWMAMQDADCVFLVSHGDFLHSGIERLAEGSPRPKKGWHNCEVREFNLVADWTYNEWCLRRASTSGCEVPVTILQGNAGILACRATPARALACVSAPAGFTEILHAISSLLSVFVFDLDDTVWRGDLDRTAGPPFTLGRGQEVMSANGTFVKPFRDVPKIFSWIEENGHIAALASAGSQEIMWPGCDCTENALRLITTRSGRTLADIMVVRRIDFAKTKDVTLREIAMELGCEPQDMVFFDNSLSRVNEALAAGITTCHGPNGLTWTAFVRCTNEYARRRRMAEKKATRVDAEKFMRCSVM